MPTWPTYTLVIMQSTPHFFAAGTSAPIPVSPMSDKRGTVSDVCVPQAPRHPLISNSALDLGSADRATYTLTMSRNKGWHTRPMFHTPPVAMSFRSHVSRMPHEPHRRRPGCPQCTRSPALPIHTTLNLYSSTAISAQPRTVIHNHKLSPAAILLSVIAW
jgi:hypothetical protein